MKILLALIIALYLTAPSPATASPPDARVEIAQAATPIDVKIQKRHVVGQRTVRVKQGDDVVLKIVTDEKVELHLHGIDVKTTVSPGQATELKFKAKITGRFPITSHGFQSAKGQKKGHGHSALMYVEIHPR